MAKIPVTISIRQEDLVRLDAFAGTRRLTRGDAVGMLLDEREGPAGADDPEYIPPPPNRSKLDVARSVLGQAEAARGVKPFNPMDQREEPLNGRDPYSQEEEYEE